MPATILIIEDEQPIRERMAKLLRFEGYEVLAADSGTVGLGMAQEHKPDLIICDLAMPELNGFNVLGVLRSHPATEAMPVVIVTGSTERSSQRKGMELGADDYLTKPFTSDELLATVRAQLAKSGRRFRGEG